MSNSEKTELNEVKNLSKEQFEALYKISKTLNSAVYPDSLIEKVLDLILEVLNAERALFVKYNEEEEKFVIISARNIRRENISNISEFSSGILQKVVKEQKPILYHDAQEDPNLSQFDSIQIQQIKSIIGVPIFKNNTVWGVCLADSRINRQDFTQENLLFLDFFSNLASLVLDKIHKLENLEDENTLLINELQLFDKIPNIIGKSEPMRKLTQVIHRISKSDTTVLITGESGSGKDIVARAIHKLSDRKDKPFLVQFCGSIPDNLLESELFGYRKGAFTGATKDKKGLFEVANNGTFFLDEIADISKALQAKLLRVIENKEILRLGDTRVKKINIRILTATNKNLKELMDEGNFREDLFYRLNVFPIKIPPLRDRKTDLHLLTDHCLKNLCDRNLILLPETLKKLENYSWPGNVRQLFNVLQRAVILCDSDKITPEHIVLEESSEIDISTATLKNIEKLILKKRLSEFNGNRKYAADSLGVSVRWIQLKLKEIESEKDDE
ncbi:sigma-54 interaction domain-containing protein [Bacteroidota bacterium]